MLLTGSDTRVVELRVHGIMGTSGEALVTSVAAVDVAGDGVGRVVRPADRLLRPAPGPVLRAEGRSVPRVVEGYVWGAMTSGGWAKAAWALLFPFSLANMAHWMLPPVPAGHRAGRVLAVVNRSLVRVAALLLTALLVAQVAVVTVDLLATQCLAPGVECLTWLPDTARTAYPVRQVVGLLPVLLVVLVLHRISRDHWRASANPPPASADLPGRGLVADPDTPALRALHLVAALAGVALLVLGGPLRVPDDAAHRVLWGVAVALLGLSVLGVLLLDDPRGYRGSAPSRALRVVLGDVPRRALLAVAVLEVVVAGAVLDPVPAVSTGTSPTVDLLAAALVAVAVLLGLLLVPAALIARPTWADQPKELRPWAGGWMAAPALAFGALLGGGFGAGLAIAVGRVIGTGTRLPEGYEPVTLLWGVGAAVAAVVSVPLLVVAVVRLVRGTGYPEAALLHSERAADAAAATQAWRVAGWQRRNLHRVVLGASLVLSLGLAGGTALRVTGYVPTAWTAPLSALGVLSLGALAGALLKAVHDAARRPESGRRLGALADLASFWPREAHPAVPPCYALKVVPELAARAAEHLKDPSTRVVLTGHSQGSLLVAVAAARLLGNLEPQAAERLGIVTAGSQLQWAYPRAFPAVVPHRSLAALSGRLGGRWRALCRGTDPIGGAVTTWSRQVCDGKLLGTGYRADGTEGPLAAALEGPHGALVLGGDHFLPDPMHGPVSGRRWVPGTLGHGDYQADPEWDRAVAMAAGLDPADPGSAWPPRRPG
ncbi:hypothetical protein [Actinokineospora bangkokensis]|uniref:Uncharacterized protein n=1 Tax=Actinokineospora bangkokensis TaxID=1193682 RepID=A0A1Q9LGE0_9PSEU|nr:hypothetical protein [Actinokineospora bangkokensis]OLR91108.1 hypothetical protein BJP25_27620 [Actinokineospora bangkokensis]